PARSTSASALPPGARAKTGRPPTRRPIWTYTRTSAGARLRVGSSRSLRRGCGCWGARREGAGWPATEPLRGRLFDQGQLSCLDDRLQLRVHAELAAQAPDVRAHGG